jgi:hypothetical protein
MHSSFEGLKLRQKICTDPKHRRALKQLAHVPYPISRLARKGSPPFPRRPAVLPAGLLHVPKECAIHDNALRTHRADVSRLMAMVKRDKRLTNKRRLS